MSCLRDSDETLCDAEVYVRSHAHGVWTVCRGESLLLLTLDGEEAFRAGCEAAMMAGGAAGPMTILSGPGCRAIPEDLLRQTGDARGRGCARCAGAPAQAAPGRRS